MADRYKVNAMKPLSSFELTYLRELSVGEIIGAVTAAPALFSDNANKLQDFLRALPEDIRPEPLSAAWIADVWLPYHETDKLTRRDARKLAKVFLVHHGLKDRYAQRRAERVGAEGIKREQDALSILKGALNGKTVDGGTA